MQFLFFVISNFDNKFTILNKLNGDKPFGGYMLFPEFQFSEKIISLTKEAENKLKPVFDDIDETTEYNSQKVLKAFIDCRVAETHFASSTGYGYGDRGRDVLDEVFAKAVGAEDALVRHNFVSGTHALSIALFGLLRCGDTLLSVTG